MDQPDYEFTSDPFGSTSDGDVFFPDVFGVTPSVENLRPL